MKKSELKNGMVVEWRDGTRLMVLNGNLIGKNCRDGLEYYNEDLTNNYGYEYMDISKVYNINSDKSVLWNDELFEFKNSFLELIWEREDLTKKEYKIGDERFIIKPNGITYLSNEKEGDIFIESLEDDEEYICFKQRELPSVIEALTEINNTINKYKSRCKF